MHYMLLHSYNLLLCVVLIVATDNYYYIYTICNVRSHVVEHFVRSHVVEHFVHTVVMETH